MTPTSSLLYIVRFHVDEAYLEEFARWYPERHGPDLVTSGFLSAQLFRDAAGGNGFLTVYDAPSENVFRRERYMETRHEDDQLDEAESHILTMTKGVYEQQLVHGEPPASLPLVAHPHLGILRYDLGGWSLEELASWVSDVVVPAAPQACAVRAGRLAYLHPLFEDLVPPDGVVLLEWGEAGHAVLPEVLPNGPSEQDRALLLRTFVAGGAGA